MVTAFDYNGQPFDYIENPDHARTDRILEFAQETGLFGMPGAEQEYQDEDYERMLRAFDLEEGDPNRDAIDLDEMIGDVFEGQERTAEEIVAAGAQEFFEGVANDTIVNDRNTIVNDHSNINQEGNMNVSLFENDYQPENGSVDGLTWNDLTRDFQDFCLEVRAEEGRADQPLEDAEAYELWDLYIRDCWQECTHSSINRMAGVNNLYGVLPSSTEIVSDVGEYDEWAQQLPRFDNNNIPAPGIIA